MHPLVFMYHGVISKQSPPPSGRETGAELYDITVQQFKDHLACIEENNRKPVLLNGDVSSAQPFIILTFDDGEKNNFDEALPVLRERGWPAYFFVTSSRVGKPGYMDWDQLSAMAAAGMVIGSHGMNHEPLTGLGDEELRQELEGSKRDLEERLNITINTFSVPRGFYDERVIRMAKAVGYRLIFVSERDPGDSACVTRIAVKKSWGIGRFRMALEGRMPAGELFCNRIKNTIKAVLGGAGYNKLRSLFLKANK